MISCYRSKVDSEVDAHDWLLPTHGSLGYRQPPSCPKRQRLWSQELLERCCGEVKVVHTLGFCNAKFELGKSTILLNGAQCLAMLCTIYADTIYVLAIGYVGKERAMLEAQDVQTIAIHTRACFDHPSHLAYPDRREALLGRHYRYASKLMWSQISGRLQMLENSV